MVFEHIENLKNTYTDKNVLVDVDRPELGRFQGLTGTVKTVNMSGRALVEFDGHKNIGWFDIDVDFLKLVDKPAAVETPATSPAAKKPAAAQPAATPTDPANMSVADMLAAARGESAAPAAAAEEPAAEEKPAAAAVDPASMSVAEMLAAARGESATPAAAAEEPAAEEPAAEEPAEEEPAEDNDGGGEIQALKEAADAAGMCAYCRKVDA